MFSAAAYSQILSRSKDEAGGCAAERGASKAAEVNAAVMRYLEVANFGLATKVQ